MTITSITDAFSASGELCEQDLTRLREDGVSTLINVRPDNEVPDQITNVQWSNFCQQHGLQYVFIPVVSGQYSEQDVSQFRNAIDAAPKKVHCFCRTGTRAVHLFALANKNTDSIKHLQTVLKDKGYDLKAISDKLN